MANFSLNDFLGKIRQEDLARAARFEVVITTPGKSKNARSVSLLCEEAAIPGLISTFTPTKIGNWTEYRVHGVEFFGDNATFGFYVDTQWGVREFFEDWIATAQVDPISKEVGFYEDYTADVEIYTLDRGDNRTGKWCLKDAFPRLINLTPLGQATDSPARVSVTFAYKYWTSDTIEEGFRDGGGRLGNVKRFVNMFKNGGKGFKDLFDF